MNKNVNGVCGILDWKTICEKCQDGEVEPVECEYYGEPNGCNSPIYGEHPKSEFFASVAAMYEALESVRNWCLNRLGNASYQVTIEGLLSVVDAGLSEPARNCDVYKTPEDCIRAFESYVREQGKLGFINPYTEVVKWLLAPATELKGEGK